MTSDPPSLPRPIEPGEGVVDRIRALVDRRSELFAGRSVLSALIAFGLVLVVGVVVVRTTLTEPPVPIEAALPTMGPVDGPEQTNRPADAASTGPPSPGSSSPGASAPVSPTVVVHVAGAVAHPGVVELPAGARVSDAVAAVGGALADADLDRVNLAALAVDGSQIAVPRRGEPLPSAPPTPAVDPGSGGGGGPIDLNTADLTALETLPGVGPATAAAIIAHREEHGPFVSVSSLDDVPGIGPTRLEALRDLVTVSR